MALRIRKNVLDYTRDSYLGTTPKLNAAYAEIDCAVGSAQWGVSPKAIEAHKEFDPRSVMTYPELFYDKLLKPAVISRFGVTGLGPEHIFLGHGSFNLAERVIHKMIEPTVLIGVGPQFNEIPSEFVAAGGMYVTAEAQPPDYAFPWSGLWSAIAQHQEAAAVYVDNPSNPLGRVISLDEIRTILQNSPHLIVIIDEAYGDFIPDEHSAMHLVPQYDNLVVLRSLSKGLGLAAERVGYMCMSAALARLYRPLIVPFEPSLYAATLGRATLGDRAFIEDVRTKVTTSKRAISAALHTAGFTILPTHPSVPIMTVHKTGVDVVAQLASIGVSVEPGSAFRKTHASWDDTFCRIRIPREDRVTELCSRLVHIASGQ